MWLCRCIHTLNGTIKIFGDRDDAAKRLDEWDKGVIFENCAPFVKCISRINNTEILILILKL